MGRAYFKPWRGSHYDDTKILILSESAYSWQGADGSIGNPSPTHPKKSILWFINRFPRRGYFTRMNRALCGTKDPSAEQMRRAWEDYAYTIYVQRTVGEGARTRPSPAQWKEASEHFLSLIEDMKPIKVIVTGHDMWKRMPFTFEGDDAYLQAYKLSNGNLVWCLALPHPSNSRVGFKWEEIGEQIRRFRAMKLPLRKQQSSRN
jgi:hypothetical protein